MKPRVAEKMQIQAAHAGDGRVLDVGFAACPNPYLHEAVGIDICLPERKPDNYAEMVRCNLNQEPIPFAEQSFDAVIAGDVIEHLENPSRFLREANRVLKSGGRLVLLTPQANDWWVTMHNWFFRKWINDPDPGEHLQNWTMLDMTRLLKKNGFTVERIEGFYMHFPRLRLAIRVRKCPMLSWQVFYVAKKTGEPDQTVLVHVDNAWQKVQP